MPSIHLDETDRTLIACLQRDARIPSRALAVKAGIPGAECVRRVRRLEASGVIRRYVTLIDPGAVGLHLTALVRVRLDRQATDRLRTFEAAMHRCDDVLQCWQLRESWDFELLVVTADIAALAAFQRECFDGLGVVAVNVNVVVRQSKHRTDFQVQEPDDVYPDGAAPSLSSGGFNVLAVRNDKWPRMGARRS